MKRKCDIYQTWCALRDAAHEADNISLGIAIAKIEWEGYIRALLDYEIITEEEHKDLLGWGG